MNGKKKFTEGPMIENGPALREAKQNLENVLDSHEKTKSNHFPRNVSDVIMKLERELKHFEKQIGSTDSIDFDLGKTIEQVSAAQIVLYRNAIFQALNTVCSNILTNTREIERLNDIVAKLPNVTGREFAMRRILINIDSADDIAPISRREKEVLVQLFSGKTNRQISHELGISEKTVKNHLWKIYRKLGVENRTQLFNRLIST